jgi:hypothetical protein
VLLAATPAAAAPPDFSGTWTFVQQKSDDVGAKLRESLGPAYTSGDIKKDEPRVWIRQWFLDQAQKPETRVLTIEQSATEFHTGLGDEVRLYYFNRESTRQGPGGVLRRATVRWQGEQLVVEEKAEKGSGHIVEIYSLLPGGKALAVAYRLEHKALPQPLELKLVFEKTAQ